MKYHFTEIAFGTPEHSESVKLRDLVLRKPLGIEFTVEQMAEEWNQMHLIARDELNNIVGVLLLMPLSKKRIKMRQVAIHPDLQGHTIGTQLVEFSERWIRQHGYITIELNARDVAIPFYERLGYRKVGKEFVEVNIPHFKMEKTI